MKKTLVIGASENSERYSNMATKRLKKYEHEVVLLGNKVGKIGDDVILTNKPQLTDIDTVTLYVSPKNQSEWIQYVLKTKPKRVIFNPGTENDAFAEELKKQEIEVVYGCTLVMLGIGTY